MDQKVKKSSHNNNEVEEDSTSSYVFRPTPKVDYHPDMLDFTIFIQLFFKQLHIKI